MEQDSRCQLAATLVAETEYDEAFLILQKLIREKYEPATQQMYLAYLSNRITSYNVCYTKLLRQYGKQIVFQFESILKTKKQIFKGFARIFKY